jgi:ABC-type nitrate/sulfonate/bicarbonate transport system substrate-binding protein
MLQPKAWLSTSGPAAPGAVRLRLSAAHSEWNHVGIALVAMKEGFFADEGLTDVELIAFEETAGELLDREAVQLDLLARGLVDIAIDPRASLVLEATHEKKSICIVAARRKNHAFVLMGREGLRTAHDLRGKTIRAEHSGGATDVMMRQALKDHGLEPDRDVTFSYSGGPMHDPARLNAAFKRGEYGPALLVLAAEVPELVESGCSVLADLRELYPSRHDRVTAANETFARDHHDVLRGFLKGMIRGCRYVLDKGNKERFVEIIKAAGFLNSEKERRSFEGLFNSWYERVSADLSLPFEGIERIAEEAKSAGRIAPSFQVKDVLRLDALREAQAALAGNPVD